MKNAPDPDTASPLSAPRCITPQRLAWFVTNARRCRDHGRDTIDCGSLW